MSPWWLLVIVPASFLAGWFTYHRAWQYGKRLMGRDKTAAQEMVRDLSFDTLMKLREATSEEIERRREVLAAFERKS